VSRLEIRIWVVPGVVFSIKRGQFVHSGPTGGEILELVDAKQYA
jgi:hypothetical protein